MLVLLLTILNTCALALAYAHIILNAIGYSELSFIEITNKPLFVKRYIADFHKREMKQGIAWLTGLKSFLS